MSIVGKSYKINTLQDFVVGYCLSAGFGFIYSFYSDNNVKCWYNNKYFTKEGANLICQKTGYYRIIFSTSSSSNNSTQIYSSIGNHAESLVSDAKKYYTKISYEGLFNKNDGLEIISTGSAMLFGECIIIFLGEQI